MRRTGSFPRSGVRATQIGAMIVLLASLTTPARSEVRGIFKLEHLIFIVQENRSFDHYFGTFPGADGIPTRDGRLAVCIPNPFLGHCSRVYHSTTFRQAGGPHDHDASVTDVDQGRMDGFISALPTGPSRCWVNPSQPGCAQLLGPGGQPDVMSFHTGHEIANYWTYARRFVLQ